jgi:hypothetical protein
MRRSLLCLWLGSGLLGSALALGCQHSGHTCSTCGQHSSVTSTAAAPAYGSPAVANRMVPSAQPAANGQTVTQTVGDSQTDAAAPVRPSSWPGRQAMVAP